MNSFRTIGFGLVASVLIPATSHAAIDDGLVSYWDFEGDLTDTFLLNNGTLVGTDPTETYTDGQFGSGILLDGVDQYVDAGNGPSLDMEVGGAGSGTGSVSISAWFRVDSFTKNWQALIAKGEGSGWRVARRGGSSIISYAGGAGDIPTDDTTGPAIDDGAFHHVVAITEDQVSTRLYVDGALVSTGGVPTLVNNGNDGAPFPENPPLMIGGNPQTDGFRTWHGVIDDVAIWDRPLTELEIADLFGNPLSALLDPNLAPVPGDVNGDRVVDFADFDIIRGNFLLSATSREEGDLNLDGIVDFVDFRSWKDNAPASASNVSLIPEPGAAIVVASGLAITLLRRSPTRRRTVGQRS